MELRRQTSVNIRLEFEWVARLARWLASRIAVVLTLDTRDASIPRNRFRDSPGVTGWKSGTRRDSPSIMGSPKAKLGR